MPHKNKKGSPDMILEVVLVCAPGRLSMKLLRRLVTPQAQRKAVRMLADAGYITRAL